MLKLHKPKCENKDITTIRTSPEPHIDWKNHFHQNPIYFRPNAVFEPDIEIDNHSIGNKTTNIYKQNLVLNDYHIESELIDILHSGYHKFPLGYNNVDWFVNEVIKLENEKAFYLKYFLKDIIMTEEDEKVSKNDNNCRFSEKTNEIDKVRDHYHLTGI